MSSGDAPLGPRAFDFASMPAEKFEEMCQLLVNIEYPDAVATGNPDGGADSLLDLGSGSVRAWQAKRFTGGIRWAQCKQSLDDAMREHQITQMTFCFARDLTNGQMGSYRRLQHDYPSVKIDIWGKARLIGLLVGSPQGERIARHFFGDPPPSAHDLAMVVRAGGPIARGEDALDRVRAIIRQTSQRDTDYAYTVSAFEHGQTLSPSPGTALSISQMADGLGVRLDATPRLEGNARQRPPSIHLTFDGDERGRKAAGALDHALRTGTPQTIDDGFEITPSNLPVLFRDLIGQPHRGSVRITPHRAAPWSAIVEAVTDRGIEEFPIDLYSESSPDDWPVHLVGRRAGLTVELDMRPYDDERAYGRIRMSHALDDSTIAEHTKALRFLSAVSGTGTLTIRDRDNRVPPSAQRLRGRPFEAADLLGLLEDLLLIQTRAGVEFVLPETLENDEAAWIQTVATVFRSGRAPIKWTGLRAIRPDNTPIPASQGVVRIEQDLTVSILGQVIDLGKGAIDLPSVRLIDLGPSDEDPSRGVVQLLPPGDEPLDIEWRVIEPRAAEPA